MLKTSRLNFKLTFGKILISSKPHPVIVDDYHLTIKMPLFRKRIPLRSIVSIGSVEREVISRSTRLVYFGDISGSVGLFTNKTLGRFMMYVTSNKNFVLIVRDNGKKIVTNCTQDLVSAVNDKIINR